MNFRSVARVLPTIDVLEGEGFLVRRPFPVGDVHQLDPFLQFDEFGPVETLPGEAKGLPEHPHRGIITATYILEGEIYHADTTGYSGVVKPGCLQWLTAGNGVIHSELPGPAMLEHGGNAHGFQIWINLPARLKRIEPSYQEFCQKDYPVIHEEEDGIHIRLMAGSWHHLTGPVNTPYPLLFAHLTIEGGCELDFPVRSEWQALFYVVEGDGKAGTHSVHPRELIQWNHNGELIRIRAGQQGVNGLLLAGEMLNEPFLRHGPFIMNRPDEIMEAIQDYRTGRFGVAVTDDFTTRNS